MAKVRAARGRSRDGIVRRRALFAGAVDSLEHAGHGRSEPGGHEARSRLPAKRTALDRRTGQRDGSASPLVCRRACDLTDLGIDTRANPRLRRTELRGKARQQGQESEHEACCHAGQIGNGESLVQCGRALNGGFSNSGA